MRTAVAVIFHIAANERLEWGRRWLDTDHGLRSLVESRQPMSQFTIGFSSVSGTIEAIDRRLSPEVNMTFTTSLRRPLAGC
jgi:hypothetical protein